jgi:hypothetical protein
LEATVSEIRVRLGKNDRTQHARGDEWFPVDLVLSNLDDTPWDDIDEIEQEYGQPISALRLGTARHLRVMVWLARRRSGIVEAFSGFKPHVYSLEYDGAVEADDADPPGPSDPSASVSAADTLSDSPAIVERPRRSGTSTRRSPGSTTSRRGKSAA